MSCCNINFFQQFSIYRFYNKTECQKKYSWMEISQKIIRKEENSENQETIIWKPRNIHKLGFDEGKTISRIQSICVFIGHCLIKSDVSCLKYFCNMFSKYLKEMLWELGLKGNVFCIVFDKIYCLCGFYNLVYSSCFKGKFLNIILKSEMFFASRAILYFNIF